MHRTLLLPREDDEIDKLEKDVKESYGAMPDIPSLAPEMFAEVYTLLLNLTALLPAGAFRCRAFELRKNLLDVCVEHRCHMLVGGERCNGIRVVLVGTTGGTVL